MLIVSPSPFFRTAAVIMHSAFSQCSPPHLPQKPDTVWLTAARSRDGSMMKAGAYENAKADFTAGFLLIIQ